MATEAMWAPWDGPGLEHLRLIVEGSGSRADGLILALADDGSPFRLSYEVRGDAGWRVREVRVEILDGRGHRLHLFADGAGSWRDPTGAPLPALDGCLDVDLTATPFTNTLPIRRLGLGPGETAEIAVAWIDAPSLRVSRDRQRYTRLAAGYRFEQVDGGFSADLPVDGDGLVLDYPGLFRRVWPR